MVALLRQILVAELIMLAAFVGLMMLTIDLNDQPQCNATEIDGVRRDRVFTTKLLAPAATLRTICRTSCANLFAVDR